MFLYNVDKFLIDNFHRFQIDLHILNKIHYKTDLINLNTDRSFVEQFSHYTYSQETDRLNKVHFPHLFNVNSTDQL